MADDRGRARRPRRGRKTGALPGSAPQRDVQRRRHHRQHVLVVRRPGGLCLALHRRTARRRTRLRHVRHRLHRRVQRTPPRPGSLLATPCGSTSKGSGMSRTGSCPALRPFPSPRTGAASFRVCRHDRPACAHPRRRCLFPPGAERPITIATLQAGLIAPLGHLRHPSPSSVICVSMYERARPAVGVLAAHERKSAGLKREESLRPHQSPAEQRAASACLNGHFSTSDMKTLGRDGRVDQADRMAQKPARDRQL